MSEVLEPGAIALLDGPLTPAVVFGPNGSADVIDRIAAEVRGIKRDISTPKGRAEIKSTAYKIARSKTALDDMGKRLNEDARARINAVDAERRVIRDRLDALAEEFRAPLTAWENKDKARIAAHEAALADIQAVGRFDGDETLDAVRERMSLLRNFDGRDWQEFEARAADLADEARQSIEARHAQVLAQIEAEAAARAEADRRRIEREAQIAAEAAARAKAEAEAAAEAVRIKAERAAQEERDRLAREVAAAQARVEAELKAAAEREAAQAAAIEHARAEAIEQERRAKADLMLAAVRAAVRAEKEKADAVAAEQQRAAAEKAAVEAEAARRAANKAHRARINREAAEVIATIESNDQKMTEDLARAVVTFLALGKIPHVSIQY